MPHRTIGTIDELRAMFRMLSKVKLPITVSWKIGRDRSLDQNALQFQWAREVSEQLGDRSIEDVRRDWKLRHGVPILRADGGDFCELYDRAIKPLPFEMKVRAMGLLSVTSRMTVKQMTQYLNAVYDEATAMGLELTQPPPKS
ncbi:MAG: hypothetical protein MJH10_15345 [Epibacterium sp.]|nr:hypothetical protein [Epibacterium sp.]NQX74894.1 hypothetical protein [Epibacterium sp.]